jgi:tetratricopeptide (TPR) repeat protein
MSNRKTAIQTTSIVLLSILATANIPARAISPDDAPSLTTKSSHIAQNNPKTADDFYAMGIFKEIQQDYQGALADYDKAIELNPKYDAIYISRADLKKKHFKDYQGALADLNKAVEFVPDFAAGYLNRAVLKIDALFYTKTVEEGDPMLSDYDYCTEERQLGCKFPLDE